MSNTIRVVLADDHVFVRDGIKSLLENEANIEVVGEATDGLEALKIVESEKPDLLILDIRMPNLTGIEVVEKLSLAFRGTLGCSRRWRNRNISWKPKFQGQNGKS